MKYWTPDGVNRKFRFLYPNFQKCRLFTSTNLQIIELPYSSASKYDEMFTFFNFGDSNRQPLYWRAGIELCIKCEKGSGAFWIFPAVRKGGEYWNGNSILERSRGNERNWRPKATASLGYSILCYCLTYKGIHVVYFTHLLNFKLDPYGPILKNLQIDVQNFVCEINTCIPL